MASHRRLSVRTAGPTGLGAIRTMNTPRIIVAMSGGVDSSVAAWRLNSQREAIAGLFMRNWTDDGNGQCHAEEDRRDAVAVCGILGIAFHFRDFSHSTGRKCSHTSLPNTPMGAPLIPTSFATAKSNSSISWKQHANLAPTALPPVTTPGSNIIANVGTC